MNGGLISVIVPVYNIEPYLQTCIDSVRGQTYENLEIILVDDGSQDRSGEICDAAAEHDSRIRVIHKKNGGLVSARKAGLEIAGGDYIGFVDGDDYIDPAFYEVLLGRIVKTDSDFVHTGFVIEKKEEKIDCCCGKEQIITNNLENCIRLIRTGIFGEKTDGCVIRQSMFSKLFRKELIRDCYVKVSDELSQGEDAICFVWCLLKARTICTQKDALYHYRKREGAYTDYTSIENIEEIWKQYAELKRIFIENDIYQHLQRCMESFYLRFTLNIVKRIRPGCDVHTYSFDKIKMLYGKKVVLYGAGAVGQDFYAQICKYALCDIVAWVDKNYKECKFDYRKVESIDSIADYQYDCILIAVWNEQTAARIKGSLEGMGILRDKIVWDKPSVIE